MGFMDMVQQMIAARRGGVLARGLQPAPPTVTAERYDPKTNTGWTEQARPGGPVIVRPDQVTPGVQDVINASTGTWSRWNEQAARSPDTGQLMRTKVEERMLGPVERRYLEAGYLKKK